MPFIAKVILVLVVLGFAFSMIQKHIPIASPFREVIYFICTVSLVLWILEGFHILHTHYFGFLS